MVLQVLVTVVLFALTFAEQRITVSLTDCNGIVNIDTEKVVYLLYGGSSIRSCQQLIYTEQSNLDLCVSPERAEIGCSISIQYAGGTYFPGSPEEEYSCNSKPGTWCTSRGVLYITFVQNGTEIKSDVQLNIYSQKGSGDSQSDKALIMGVVIGCSVFVLACLAIVGYCCFVRRCSDKFYRNRHKPKAVPTNEFQMSSSR